MKKLAWFSLLFVSMALQAAPDRPQVRVRVAPKELTFDWTIAPTAQRYELWYRPTTNAAWRKLHDRPSPATSASIAVSVHLLDWREVRFRVDACDFVECTPSAEVPVDQLMRYPVGYFKPWTPGETQRYGSGVALSADGRTMAVSSYEGFNPRLTISLYRRIGAAWVTDGVVLPQPGSGGSGTFRTLALSGNGTVLAVGAPDESDLPAGMSFTGAAYIYRRVNGNWQLEQRLVSTDSALYWSFGRVVEMDDAGERIAVMVLERRTEHSGEFRLYRNVGGSWVTEKIFPVPSRESNWYSVCGAIALSGDGNRLVRQCARNDPVNATYVQTFTAPTWDAGPELVIANDFTALSTIDINGDGTLLAASVANNVTSIWRWSGAAWQPDGPNGTRALINFAAHNMKISRNGNYLAIGSPGDRTTGLGVVYPPFTSGLDQTGTVRIFERRGGAWPLLHTLKSNTPTQQLFGASLAMSGNGSVLAVGAPFESSDAIGIDGDQHDTSARESGAVWLY